MFFYYFMRVLFYIPSRIFLPARNINKKNMPKKRAILSCNHLSFIDPVAIGMYNRRRMRFFAKKELSKNWFMRWAVPTIGSVFVDRGQADVAAVKQVLQILKNDNVLMIFPEGTRNKDGAEMQELKTGAIMFAIKTDTKITPVIMWRKPKALRRNFIYYGEPIDLSRYKGVKMTPEEKWEATAILTDKMGGAREELSRWLMEKRPGLYRRHERNVKRETRNVKSEM